MEILPYCTADLEEMARLFYETVHTVNAADYTPRQLDVWATGQIDRAEWDRSFRSHLSLVAREGEMLVGFGDLDPATGYLDRLYVHKDFQGRGIATALCDRLEAAAPGRAFTHASITARPFFEGRGYRVQKEQQVFRQGVALTNFVMEKNLGKIPSKG